VILCARGAELRQAMFAASRQLTPADGTAGYCRYLAGIDRETEARRVAAEELRSHNERCEVCHANSGRTETERM
jgi:precorrin-3B methylase